MTTSPTVPWEPPLVVRAPAPPVVPEPPRRGEPGGGPCGVCLQRVPAPVWSDDLWTLHPPVGCSLPGTVWLASRDHVDSFADLSPAGAGTFGAVAARVERAVLGLGEVGRVHVYRWGDTGAHFHVWFFPRPLGMVEAYGAMLPLWEDTLPNRTDEEVRAAAERVGEQMGLP